MYPIHYTLYLTRDPPSAMFRFRFLLLAPVGRSTRTRRVQTVVRSDEMCCGGAASLLARWLRVSRDTDSDDESLASRVGDRVAFATVFGCLVYLILMSSTLYMTLIL